MMQSESEIAERVPFSENADIEYILELFDNQELGLTITEDREESEKSVSISRKRSEEGDFKEDITDERYRNAFLHFFHHSRKEAVEFVDAAIRLMNCVKKMKLQELLNWFSGERVFDAIAETLITADLLVQPIEEELASPQITERDARLYQEVLRMLKSGDESRECKAKIQSILSEVDLR